MNKYLLNCALLLSFLLVLGVHHTFATHIRAGDLTATRLDTGNPNVLTFRFTIVLYRDTEGVPAQEGEIDFGTGNPNNRVVVSPVSLGFINGGTTEILLYETVFTFSSPGEYTVSYFERNRNPGVLNMFNSIDTPFFIESTFLISPILGLNNSPILLIPPIDEARVGQRFIHNPGAFDPEGDSLSYQLTINKKSPAVDGDAGLVINYRFPDELSDIREDGTAPAEFSIDPITGDLIWDAPKTPGEYNVAFYIDEWRDGIRIGRVNRDMQIVVRDHNNERPNIIIPRDTCIVAGSTLEASIFARDPDGDLLILTAANQSGSLFDLPAPSNSATFDTLGLQPPNGFEEGIFRWETVCEDVRREPYQATFKAVDTPISLQNQLADLQTWRITVVGPSPDTLIALPDLVRAQVELSWNNYQCGNAVTMSVWRREGGFPFDPVCETGLPAYTGYTEIGEVDINTLSFNDDNKGQGLERGKEYCYRIFARFRQPEGGESLASMEVCVFIPRVAPYMTNVSVDSTSTTEGQISVRWTKPIAIDDTEFPRPYTYQLLRAEGFNGNANLTLINQTFEENDTTFVDTGLNTSDKVYNYYVRLLSQGVLADFSDKASSVRLTVSPSIEAIQISWQAQVPWVNRVDSFPQHYIYRRIEGEQEDFELIDSVNVFQSGFAYVDRGRFNDQPLEEGKRYCYRVSTFGDYLQEEIKTQKPLINFSQEACDSILVFTPTNAPFVTNVSIERTDRTTGEIFVRWTKVIGIDTADFPRPHTYQVGKAIGFSGRGNFELLPTIFSENDTSFTDTNLNTAAIPYNYRVYFYSEGILVDSSEVASSVRLNAASTLETIALSWEAQTPWRNNTNNFRFHYIYRKRVNDEVFTLLDSVDVTANGFRYQDNGSVAPLDPTQEYCYFVTTQGTYLNPFIDDPLLNKSQEACAVLLDIIPPCLPLSFNLETKTCEDLSSVIYAPNDTCPVNQTYENIFSWIPDLTPECQEDLAFYNIYYKPRVDSAYTLLASVTDTFFVHQNLTSIAGCYTLTTVDLAGNESAFMPEICIDTDCAQYELPNVFTPNNDGSNDLFVPFRCPLFVEKVDFKVYNRWGELVYESDDDIYLNWDGTNHNGKELSNGLYYYTATVKFFRLNAEDEILELKGWIQLMRN